jgi:hypothetical protein
MVELGGTEAGGPKPCDITIEQLLQGHIAAPSPSEYPAFCQVHFIQNRCDCPGCSTVLAMKSIQNSKCRIQNIRSFLFSLRLDNNAGQNFEQFFAFFQQGCEAAFRN